MALFAISDLHLSFSADKPMNVFGSTWDRYEERMENNWNSIVSSDDTVLLCGDISWATYIDDTVKDFDYINRLNGRKIILKGNHDYWWTTLAKMERFFKDNGFSSVNVLHNNSFSAEGISICGTRGWIARQQCKNAEDEKIYLRELQRLELSLQSAENDKIIVCLHYPPDEQFLQLMNKYNATKCLFGHLHAKSHLGAPQGIINGIECKLVSCDYLDFTPFRVD